MPYWLDRACAMSFRPSLFAATCISCATLLFVCTVPSYIIYSIDPATSPFLHNLTGYGVESWESVIPDRVPNGILGAIEKGASKVSVHSDLTRDSWDRVCVSQLTIGDAKSAMEWYRKRFEEDKFEIRECAGCALRLEAPFCWKRVSLMHPPAWILRQDQIPAASSLLCYEKTYDDGGLYIVILARDRERFIRIEMFRDYFPVGENKSPEIK